MGELQLRVAIQILVMSVVSEFYGLVFMISYGHPWATKTNVLSLFHNKLNRQNQWPFRSWIYFAYAALPGIGTFSSNDSLRLKAGANDSPVSGDPAHGCTAAVLRVRQSAQSSRLQILPHLAEKDHGAASRYAG